MSKQTPSNKEYWQKYKPGEIPSVPNLPPSTLFENKKSNILDIGTGDGKVAEQLANKGYNVYGIDIAENIIESNISRKSKVIYSVQDISRKTSFSPSFFDIVLSRFVFTNIQKDDREPAVEEIHRILKPHGKLWILEPLVSDSYNLRYELAKDYSDDENAVVVFKEKDMAETVTNSKQMEHAFKNDMFSRIVKHYTEDEIVKIFKPLSLSNSRLLSVKSPSGYSINTFEGIFEKK